MVSMEVKEEYTSLETGVNFIREKYNFFDNALPSNSLTDVNREVILGLTTIGLIQLEILEPIPDNTNSKDYSRFLLKNKHALEKAYLEMATSLREASNNGLHRFQSNNNNNNSNAHDVNKRKFCKKLERNVNIVKVTVAGSKKVADSFQVSNYKYLIKMIEKTFMNCPWSDSPSTSEWSFVHEFSNSATEIISKESAHLLFRDLEKTIGTMRELVRPNPSSKLALHSSQHSLSVLMISDPEPDAEDTLAVAARILATDLVMEEILDNLDFESLLSSRLVSRQLNHYVIRKNKIRSFIIPTRFEYDDQSKQYLSNKSINGVRRNLSEFTLFLTSVSTATELPFSTFSFTKGALWTPSKDLIEFFIIHGMQIQELHLQLQHCQDARYRRNTIPSFVLAKLLRRICFVEKLVLENLPWYWCVKHFDDSTATDAPPLFPPGSENTKLNNLKSLEIQTYVRDKFFLDFLAAGCNLETCGSFESIIPFLKLNKFHLLQKLWWGVEFAPGDIEFFRKFMDNNMEITSNIIEFGIYVNRWLQHRPDLIWTMTKAVNKILQSCSQTIETFHLFTPLSNFPGLQLPFLPKVKTLSIQTRPHFVPRHYWHISTNKFFPPGTNLPLVFPRVQKITLGFTHYEFEALPSFSDAFEFTPSTVNLDKEETMTLKTVKCIEVIKNLELPVEWMEGLSVLCPNVESIRINTIFYDVQDAMNGLWKFGKVKNIELNINVRVAEETPFIIDAAFTGFSVSACQDLFNRLTRTDPEPESLQYFRVNSSLLDLKEMENLKVTFVDPNLEELGVGFDPGVWRIFSKVTQFYAFDLCPRLNICFSAAARTEARSTDLLLKLAEMSSSAHLHCPALTLKEGWSTPFSHVFYSPASEAELANVINPANLVIPAN